MAMDVLDNNFILGCKAFVVREMVFHHSRGDFRTGHVWTHTNGTVFSVTQLNFLLTFTAIPMHMFIFIFIFFSFFFLRSPTVLATALDYCRIFESTKTLLCDDCLTCVHCKIMFPGRPRTCALLDVTAIEAIYLARKALRLAGGPSTPRSPLDHAVGGLRQR
jgi:hypothetical protein